MLKRTWKLFRLSGITLVVAGASASSASCLEGADIALGDCPNPDYGHLNRNGNLDPCCFDRSVPCHTDSECDGKCMPTNVDPAWSRNPVLFWFGDFNATAPLCPESSEGHWEAYADPVSAGNCPACICSEPACVPPASVSASEAIGCDGPTIADLPIAADGSCSMSTSIPTNALKSLAVISPKLSPCTPSTVPIQVPIDLGRDTWNKRSKVCRGTGNSLCARPEEVCSPSTAPLSGFMQCLENVRKGDEVTPCPDEGKDHGYLKKFVVYEHIDWDVACTLCTCGAPVGS